MMDSADPIDGWSAKDVAKKGLLAKNDIYGSLYVHVRDILFAFCYKLKTVKTSFQLFNVDALELPALMKQRGVGEAYFDRIEVRFMTRIRILY
jgi:hypothetical protein